jgi:hypothetical protein
LSVFFLTFCRRAELPRLIEKGDTTFHNAMIELGVFMVMTVSLVACLVMLRKRSAVAVEQG